MNLGDSTTYTVTDQDAAGNPGLVAGEQLAGIVTSVDADGTYTVAVFGTDASLTARTVTPEQAAPAEPTPDTNTAISDVPPQAGAAVSPPANDDDISQDVTDVAQSVDALTDDQRQQLRDALAAHDAKSSTTPASATASDTPIGDSVQSEQNGSNNE